MADAIGPRIRALRRVRGMSQFELAGKAGFSARHVSFVETGRTRPSQEAVLAFGEALDLTLRERNHLLEAAGFAHAFRETPLSAEEMAHVLRVFQFILNCSLPYAAVAVDRHWNCLLTNRAADQFFSLLLTPALSAPPSNVLRFTFHPDGSRRYIVNWQEVERHLLGRAEVELGSTEDPVGAQLLAEIKGYATPSAMSSSTIVTHPGDLLLPIHIQMGDLDLRLFSTVMTLCTAQDVTLQELRIETFFPADPESEQCWKQHFA